MQGLTRDGPCSRVAGPDRQHALGLRHGLHRISTRGSRISGPGLTAFTARFGGGLDFYLTESLALDISAAYNLQTGDLTGGDYTSLVIGAQYHF